MIEYIIRAAQKKDLADLLELSQFFLLHNLPDNKQLLKKKLEQSEEAFQNKKDPFNRNYIFVLEHLKNKKLIGSSQILSFSAKNPFYYYLLKNETGSAYLELTPYIETKQQFGGLILNKNYRSSKEQLGLQLGLARLLYMKTKEKDFSKTLEVSLTGHFQEENNPFWMETGAKYLNRNYLQAVKLYQEDPKAILKKFPKEFKINLDSLSQKAISCLKTVNPQSFPAYKGLLKSGFETTPRHYLLDGCFYLESKTARLLENIETLEVRFGLSQSKLSQSKLSQSKMPETETYFLISKIEAGNFLSARVRGEKSKGLLRIEKNSLFQENEKVLSLPIR